jgi:hypothetical protein
LQNLRSLVLLPTYDLTFNAVLLDRISTFLGGHGVVKTRKVQRNHVTAPVLLSSGHFAGELGPSIQVLSIYRVFSISFVSYPSQPVGDCLVHYLRTLRKVAEKVI